MTSKNRTNDIFEQNVIVAYFRNLWRQNFFLTVLSRIRLVLKQTSPCQNQINMLRMF